MVLGKLDSDMSKNEIRTFSNIAHKNNFKMDWRPKCKTRYYETPRGKQAEHSDINWSNIFFGSLS